MEIVVLTILRFLIPLIILRFPILGIIASMYLDLQDFNYFKINNQAEMDFYQRWDKFFDTYYLAIAFYTSLSWKDKIAKKLSILFFFWRLIGVIIFLFFPARTLLLFFPNLFENLFLFYNFFRKFSNTQKLFISSNINSIIVASIIIPKLFAEYYLHVINSPTLFNLDRNLKLPILPATLHDFATYFLYIGLTVGILIWRILSTKKSKRKA